MYSDSEAERRVLSALTNSESACIEAFTQLESKDFADPLHQDIFDLALSIYSGGHQPNAAIVMREGMMLGLINGQEQAEAVNYVISGFVDSDIQYWINKVSDASKGRAFSEVLRRYQESTGGDIDETLGQAIGDLSLISAGKGKNEFEDGPMVADCLEKLMQAKEAKYEEARLTGKIVMDGLPTGYAKLDQVTLGYKPGDLIVLGAQTGHGKTAFALQTSKVIAVEHINQLLYINTEMSKELIYMRLAANIAGIPFYNVRQGNLIENVADRGRFNAAIKSIRRSGFIHKYSPDLTPARCIMDARKAKIQKKIDMIIIDYVGRMEKHDPKMQEWQVLEQIVKSQKILAQELQIPIMILAQLNPDGTLQGAKRIKNECDMLLKLMPIDKDEAGTYAEYANANYRIYVDKNRDGDSDLNVPLYFDKAIQRLETARFKQNETFKGVTREKERGRND